MNRNSKRKIARTVHRSERTPINNAEGPTQRPSTSVFRWAISPTDGIPSGVNADGTFKSAVCTIYDWLDGKLENSTETGKVYNWSQITIPGNRKMCIIAVDSNEEIDTYAVFNVECGTS